MFFAQNSPREACKGGQELLRRGRVNMLILGKRQDADMNAIEAPEPRERVASWWPWSAPRASRWRSTLGRGGLP